MLFPWVGRDELAHLRVDPVAKLVPEVSVESAHHVERVRNRFAQLHVEELIPAVCETLTLLEPLVDELGPPMELLTADLVQIDSVGARPTQHGGEARDRGTHFDGVAMCMHDARVWKHLEESVEVVEVRR